jgi:hypothetical protein
MKVEELSMDREKARGLWRKYHEHVSYQQPYDAEIAAIYKRLAQGKTVIKAIESIRAAGLNGANLPKLAICRADFREVRLRIEERSISFGPDQWPKAHHHRRSVSIPWPNAEKEMLSHQRNRWQISAVVPIIPVHLRPARGLANYHILWEAEWEKKYPVDPYLLRRFGGDAWLVVAAWDLTDVERAVMANRVLA